MDKRKFNPVITYPPKGNMQSGVIDVGEFPSATKMEFEIIGKELGYPFTSVGFQLPFCVHLENGIYPVRLYGAPNVIKHIKMERKEILYVGGRGENVEMPDDPRGLFRFSICEVYFQGGYPNNIDDTEISVAISNMLDLLDIPALQKLSVTDLPEIQKISLPSDKKDRIKCLSANNLKSRLKQVSCKLDVKQQHALFGQIRKSILLKRARAVTNRFIDVYRNITKSFYMPNIRDTDILASSTCHFPSAGVHDSAVEIRFPNGMTLSVPDRSIQNHEKIWDMLNNEATIQIYELMMHTAQRHLLEENYYSAVVEAFSAFELYIDKALLKVLISKGRSEQEAEDYITQDRNWQITVRVKDLFQDITGHDLGADSNYQVWTLAKKLRDDIVHAGKRNVSEEEALKAITAITKLWDVAKNTAERL